LNVQDWANQIAFYNQAAKGKVRLLVYGESGSGKTTLAGTFPNAFFIDTDKGGRTLKDKHIPFLEMHRGEQTFFIIWDLLQRLEKKAAPFDKIPVETLVFDSLTSLADFLLVEAMKFPPAGMTARDPNKSKPEWDHYALVQSRMKSLMKYAQDLGLNVVATAGVKLERDEILGSFVGKPNIVGSYRDLVAHDFDECYFLDCEEKGLGKPPEYVAHTHKFRYFEAKSRDGVADRIVNPSYDTLWAKEKVSTGEEKKS
jgi:hypothetical protein